MTLSWSVDVLQSFLLAASTLFSIVNPMGGALLFAQVTGDRSHADRLLLARRVGMYAAMVMLASLWIGAYVLDFFGVSIPALRIAGGLVVAASGWRLLNAPETHEDRKQAQADDATRESGDDIAFFPLTLPLTTGPGTISVAIALGSNRPAGGAAFASFAAGVTLGALAIATVIWLAYSWADWITNLLGPSRIRIIARLAAFILLCVGVQITMNGLFDAVKLAGLVAAK